MPVRISASAVERLLACPFSFRDGLRRTFDPPGEAAQTGTAFHSLAEAHLNGICDEPQFPPLANVERARRIYALWAPWWEENRGRTEWLSEVPFAINIKTGEARILPSRGQRDYSRASADEITGTADYVAVTDSTVVIGDFKTGRADYTTAAHQNAQLMTLALAATRAYGRDTAEVELLFVSDLAPPWPDRATFDVLDTDLFEMRLQEAVAAINGSAPKAGKHCQWCPVSETDCSEKPVRLRRKKAA